jgi:hypothetical protein
MIEKSKGVKLGKLRVIQLIEADLQIIMRLSIKNRNIGKIEQDKRISKSNFESRSKYLIE